MEYCEFVEAVKLEVEKGLKKKKSYLSIMLLKTMAVRWTVL